MPSVWIRRARLRVRPFLLGLALGAAPVAVAAPTVEDKAAPLLDRLAHAPDTGSARDLEAQLLAVWTDRLSPTARLMTRRAEREIGDHRYGDAVADLNDTLAMQPGESELWRRLALAQAEAGDDDAAIRSLGGALSREPRNIFAWRDLSMIEESRHDDAAALRAWQKLLELDPKTDGAQARAKALDLKANGAPT